MQRASPRSRSSTPPSRSTTWPDHGSSPGRRPTRPPTRSSTPVSTSRCSPATANTSPTAPTPTSSEAVPGWGPGLVDGGPATTTGLLVDHRRTRSVPGRDADQRACRMAHRRPPVPPSPTSRAAGERSPSRRPTPDWPQPSTPTARPTARARSSSSTVTPTTTARSASTRSPPSTSSASATPSAADAGLPVAGTSPSTQPSISGDGQLVAFVTRAPNLQLIEVPGVGSGDDGDLLLAEIRNGRLTRLTETVDGILPTPGVHAHPDLSDTGRTAVFDTAAAADLLVEGALAGRQVVARSSDPLLSLPDADMGTTLVGLASDEWYVAVINDGPSSFRPTSVTVSNPRFEINPEKSTCLLDISVPAGGDCTVALTFTPTAPGASSAIADRRRGGLRRRLGVGHPRGCRRQPGTADRAGEHRHRHRRRRRAERRVPVRPEQHRVQPDRDHLVRDLRGARRATSSSPATTVCSAR